MNWRGTLRVDSLDLFGVLSSRRDRAIFAVTLQGPCVGRHLGFWARGDSDLYAVRLRARE